MGHEPLVSVLIPVFNAGPYLRSAVESVLAQTYQEIEIIVVDDGSTDGCIETIKHLQDARIKIVHQANAGKAAAVNRGLKLAQGEFFLIQDADDLCYPLRVERQLKRLLAEPALAAVFVGNDIVMGKTRFAPRCPARDVQACADMIDRFQIPAHDATGMYRRSMVREIGFDERFRIGQGIDFILRVGECCPMEVMGECLYTYRINYRSTIRQDATHTVDMIRQVLEEACRRRGLTAEAMAHRLPQPSRFQHRNRDTAIIPHCMNSVLQSRQRRRYGEAIRTAWICLLLKPYDPYYYKPAVYALLPLGLIQYYRKRKESIQ